MYVYTLSDPRTGEIRYVGLTLNPAKRKYGHTHGNSSASSGAWIEMLLAIGLEPVFEVAQKTGYYSGHDAECYHIRRCLDRGHRLLNRVRHAPYGGFREDPNPQLAPDVFTHNRQAMQATTDGRYSDAYRAVMGKAVGK